MRTPTWKHLGRFCQVEGWEDRDAARGRPTGDHKRYRLQLPNGDVLLTKVSHGRAQIAADLVKHILRSQLGVTEEEFWAAVDRRKPPQREAAPKPPAGHRLPARLVEPLAQAGVTDEELRTMSVAEAEKRVREVRRTPRRRRPEP